MNCNQCGRDNCDGHWCDACGRNAEAPIMDNDKFYCDKFCLFDKEPNNPLLIGVSPQVADVTVRMRKLKKEVEATTGARWIS